MGLFKGGRVEEAGLASDWKYVFLLYVRNQNTFSHRYDMISDLNVDGKVFLVYCSYTYELNELCGLACESKQQLVEFQQK